MVASALAREGRRDPPVRVQLPGRRANVTQGYAAVRDAEVNHTLAISASRRAVVQFGPNTDLMGASFLSLRPVQLRRYVIIDTPRLFSSVDPRTPWFRPS